VKKKSILVVEDDKAILKGLRGILQSEDYGVDTAETGQEALQKFQNKLFNLALLDIKLPDVEGTELLKIMHKNQPEMMKIMVTGYPSLENAVIALNQGADAYVIKPVKPEKLLDLIEDKLDEQSEAEKMTEEKVTEWIKTRARKIANAKG